MDYPKSVPSVGLAGGRFVDEDPLVGTPGSLIPAQWGNATTDEILNVILAAGLTPDEVNNTQLVSAIRLIQKQPVLIADTGAANAYSAINAPALSAFPASGYIQRLVIAHANTGASTYAPDGLAAKPLYGLGLQPLQGGELPVGVAVLMYLVQAGVNGGNGAWIVIESLGGSSQVAPATKSQHALQLGQAQALPSSLQSVAASVSSNALTLTWSAQPLVFRSTTLNNGTVTPVSVSGTLSLTVPSGATLGASNGALAQLAILALNNGGTPQLGIVNMAGSVNLDETSLVNATAISAASSSASIIYSGSALTGVPFRIVGYITITEAAAGTWATAPVLVQGYGGQNVAGVLGSCAAFASSLSGVTGYQKLPSGLILQWGSLTTSSSSDTAVTFPIAFPTSLYSITTSVGATAGAIYGTTLNAQTLSGFVASTYNSANTRINTTIYWMALGK
ncbi:hypothetical protein [Pseudomonas sp. PS01299]|uniref:gp53-like domain-containing protein n=1 Tax=Pseudomonas sp. PS01299 TaxID=2991435 RepID=UPI00249AA768|nr:hypothetical protein [Pseudomonas sp. PS01299]